MEILVGFEFDVSILIFLTLIVVFSYVYYFCSKLELGLEFDQPFLLNETLCEAYLSSWGGSCDALCRSTDDLLLLSSLGMIFF